MIIFLVTAGHAYTIAGLKTEAASQAGIHAEAMDYARALAQTTLPRATYVFTDFERMYPWELRLAGRLYKVVRAAGCTAINNPARVMTKYQLLRTLHRLGMNKFTTYRADDLVAPARFPVFIRSEQDHQSVVHDLIPDQKSLAAALRRLVSLGISLRGLLVTEYCGEEFAPGRFRRFGMFKIGEHFVPETMVINSKWAVKDSMKDPDGENVKYHPLELAFVQDKTHLDFVRRAFEAGNIGYGRADIGVVGGEPQIYEINTAPHLKAVNYAKLAPTRHEAVRLSWRQRLEAYAALDGHRGETGSFAVADDWLDEDRARQVTARAGMKDFVPVFRP